MSSEPNRTEAAARALWENLGPDSTEQDDAYVALAAADAWDAANGYVRIRIDDATEKIAAVIADSAAWPCVTPHDLELARAVVAVLTERNTE